MIEVIKKIKVDLLRKSPTRLIFATQHDAGLRRVAVTLTNDGKPIELGSGIVVHANYLRPDGVSGAVMCEITGSDTVEFTIPIWVLAVVGEVKCAIALFKEGNERVTSAPFSIDVESELYSGDDVVEDEDYPIMLSLMSTLAGFSAEEEERRLAESGRAEAELERQRTVDFIKSSCVVIASESEPNIDGAFVWFDTSSQEEIVLLEASDLPLDAIGIDSIGNNK